MRLPAGEHPPAVASEPAEELRTCLSLPRRPPAGHAPLALIVEDEEPIRAFLRTTLQGQGWRVVEAARGQDALRRTRRCSRPTS